MSRSPSESKSRNPTPPPEVSIRNLSSDSPLKSLQTIPANSVTSVKIGPEPRLNEAGWRALRSEENPRNHSRNLLVGLSFEEPIASDLVLRNLPSPTMKRKTEPRTHAVTLSPVVTLPSVFFQLCLSWSRQRQPRPNLFSLLLP